MSQAERDLIAALREPRAGLHPETDEEVMKDWTTLVDQGIRAAAGLEARLDAEVGETGAVQLDEILHNLIDHPEKVDGVTTTFVICQLLRERDEARQTLSLFKDDLFYKWKQRAKTAEARVKELELEEEDI